MCSCIMFTPRACAMTRRLKSGSRTLGQALSAAAQYQRDGKLGEARAIYEQILRLFPGNADALHLSGVLEYQLGNLEPAAHLIRRSLRKSPSAFAHCNLGVVRLAQGDANEATWCFGRALALRPDYAEAHNNMAAALLSEDRAAEALESAKRALAIRPEYGEAHYNLGLALRRQQKVEEAIASFRRAIALEAVHPHAHNDLGAALQAQGKRDEAIVHYRIALALKPDFDEAHNNLGTALFDQGHLEEAMRHYERALAAKAASATVFFNLGKAFLERCQPAEAVSCFTRAHQLEPGDRNGIAIATAISPVIISSHDLRETRQRVTSQLNQLRNAPLALDDPLQQGLGANVLLAYHGLDNRALHESLAAVYLKACPSLGWVAPHCLGPPPCVAGRRIKVGFLSRYFYRHTVGEVMHGLIEHLDRVRFDVTVFRVGDEQDELARAIDAAAERSIRVPNSLDEARRMVAAHRLDVLVYPEIGMDPGTYFLAFSRLAPCQCVMWGHPDTTGIPHVDYYVSAECVEPDDAQSHYSETLIKLAHIPTYYRRPQIPQPLPDREALGLPGEGNLYVCSQTMYKFHPDFDAALGAILRRDSTARLVLFHGRQAVWSDVLGRRLHNAFPDVAHRVLYLPRLARPKYFAILMRASAVLDTFHFGGGNTIYQAFGLGVPVVTLPGGFARGRIAYGLYRKMQIEALIARDPEHYVDLAVRLATDGAFRASMLDMIAQRSQGLFENHEAVHAFERWLEEVCRAPH
jgi:predicted O-linked N-acetylglucosamine transferase (SPINDLY family)